MLNNEDIRIKNRERGSVQVHVSMETWQFNLSVGRATAMQNGMQRTKHREFSVDAKRNHLFSRRSYI